MKNDMDEKLMNIDVNSAKERVSTEEWQTRVDLAALYRLVALHGWDDLVFTHLTARVPGSEEHFLINPYGLMFEEVTASSLVKVDLQGNKLDDSPYDINPAGYLIHAAIHEVREDAQCVIHLHTRAGVAVSAQTDGLLPISQQATVVLPSLAYHDYEGIALNPEERTRLQADLSDKTYMILRNHGLLTVGPCVADAYITMYILETACQIQVMAQSGGTEVIHVGKEIIDHTEENIQKVTRGMGGKLAWPSLLRKLDRLDSSYKL